MFDTSLFASPQVLVLGLLTGLVFGFLLEKGGVTRYETIVGQFLMRDHTVIKVMLTAIVVGGLGVYGMLELGWIEGLHVKGAQLWMNGIGGLVFGVGMALLGYCPGTGVAAVGSGSRDAMVGVAGMLAGSALYAEAYPWLSSVLGGKLDLGKATLATVTGVSPFAFLGALALLGGGVFLWLGRTPRAREERPEQASARPTSGRVV